MPYSNFPKKSFIISFDEENLFEDREIVNLKAEWDDPTFCREYLAYDLFQRAGLEAPLAWFVQLFVNGIYIGLYLDVEEIDEHFLSRTSLDDNATIYEADTIGCLLRPGEDLIGLWQKITNIETGVYDLWDLIEWIDIAHDEYFLDDFEDYFGSENLPRHIAVNSLIGNTSTYYDNYALIHDLTENGFWYMLPWNADSCYVFDDEYTEPEFYRSGHPALAQTNALIRQCWEYDPIRELILGHVEGIMDSLFTQEYYQTLSNALNSLLTTAVENDTAKQFTYDDFYAGLRNLPQEVFWRSYKMEWNTTHRAMPFDLNPALLTPEGVYLSWDTTSISTGANVAYSVQIANDPLFENITGDFYTSASTSLLYDDLDSGQYYWRAFAINPTNLTTRTLTYYSTFEVPDDPFNGTTLSGTIEYDTTWDAAGNPYSLPQGITIAPGAILTIEPGVTIGLGAGQSFRVYGGLNAIGTTQDSIYFVPLNPDYYWGSLLLDNPTDEINLGFVNITKLSTDFSGPWPGGGIQHASAQLYIFDSHIYDGINWGISGENTDMHLERVIVERFVSILGNNHSEASTLLRDCRFQYEAAFGPSWGLVDFEATSEYSEISRCAFFGNKMNETGDNIDMDFCDNVFISRNYFRGAGDNAITLSNCHSINITNNIMVDCFAAMEMKNNSDAVMYNNIIIGNGTGIGITSDIMGLDVFNSVIWGNDADIDPYAHPDVNINYSLVGDDTPYPGSGNIAGNPGFVDGFNSNFYPRGDSPLIDAGYGTDQPELDLIDSSRIDIEAVQNTGAGEIEYVDIGVYEYRDGVMFPPGVKPSKATPQTYTLLSNYPNPFNAVTHIEFLVQQTGSTSLKIFDITGRTVFSREFERLLPGIHTIMWDGRNQANRQVASGMYICSLAIQDHAVKTIKMLLLK
jgi:spore coat protein H